MRVLASTAFGNFDGWTDRYGGEGRRSRCSHCKLTHVGMVARGFYVTLLLVRNEATSSQDDVLRYSVWRKKRQRTDRK